MRLSKSKCFEVHLASAARMLHLVEQLLVKTFGTPHGRASNSVNDATRKDEPRK